jgi:hypothetical protein
MALSRANLAVWLILYPDVKRDGTARASRDDLALRRGIDRQRVGRALRRLASRKILQVIRRGGLNRGPSAYRYRYCRHPCLTPQKHPLKGGCDQEARPPPTGGCVLEDQNGRAGLTPGRGHAISYAS